MIIEIGENLVTLLTTVGFFMFIGFIFWVLLKD
jgi:hypothetical protein